MESTGVQFAFSLVNASEQCQGIFAIEIYPDHTDEILQTAVTEATSTGTSIDGVMGKSPQTDVLDLVNSIPVDYMHAYLEDVIKPFYLGCQVTGLDKDLLIQQPPTKFTQPPRSIR